MRCIVTRRSAVLALVPTPTIAMNSGTSGKVNNMIPAATRSWDATATTTTGGTTTEVFDVTAYDLNPANIADKFKREKVMVRMPKESQ